jgi:fructose-bisphosphate aldolase class II
MFKKRYAGLASALSMSTTGNHTGHHEGDEEKGPLILQVSSVRASMQDVYLKKLIEAAMLDAERPPALTLHICVNGHGDTFELCKSCIDGGCTSVMIDGSTIPFEENIS